MGNLPSIQDLSSAAVADLLVKENPAYQKFAEKLFHGDGFLSLVDGNYLLSLDFDKPKDVEAFESIMEAMEVSPRFLHKSLENLLRMMQQRSLLVNHPSWSQQQEKQQELQPSYQDTSTQPTSSLGVAARRYADVAASAKQTKKSGATTSTHEAQSTSSLGVAAQRYADVAISGKDASKKPDAVKTNQVQLFRSTRGGRRIKIGPVTLADPSPQTELLWKGLREIVLKDYTTDLWARNAKTNATIEAAEERGANEIADLVRDLGGLRESVFGRFLVEPDSHASGAGSVETVTGVIVISYLQSMRNKKGRVECCIEKDIRRIKDCPLEPLPWQSPSATKLTSKLSRASPPFRPTMSPASVSTESSCAMSWTPVRKKKQETAASPTTVMASQHLDFSEEPVMIKFRQLLMDTKLKEAFSGQQDVLEATDLWSEQEGAFGELSNALKEVFVSVVSQAVNVYNAEANQDLVVRKGSKSMRKLNRVTIFKNEDVAKRYAMQNHGKTKVCRFWLKGTCDKGDKCTYAHGVHEVVRESTPEPVAQEPEQQALVAPEDQNEEKDETSDTPSDVLEKDGSLAKENESNKAGISNVVDLGVMPPMVERAVPEVVQENEIAKELVVPTGATQEVQADIPSVATLESAKVAKIPDTVAEPVKRLEVEVSGEPKESSKVSDDTTMVDMAAKDEFDLEVETAMAEALDALGPEGEFDLNIETAMAEALEALGVGKEEAAAMLEDTEEKAEEDTAPTEKESFDSEETTDKVEATPSPEEATKNEMKQEEAPASFVECTAEESIVDADQSEEVTDGASDPSFGSCVASQELESPVVETTGHLVESGGGGNSGIGRWGDCDSSSESD